MSTARERLIDLVNYVEHLIRMEDKANFSLKDYRQPAFHEFNFSHNIGIERDGCDEHGPFWLRLSRLKRHDPPEIPTHLRNWILESEDPYSPPKVRDFVEVERDGAPELSKEKDVPRRDILRLEELPDVQKAIDKYVNSAWPEWAEKEKPRRETIRIYEALFNLQQTIQSTSGERALELVFGIGQARWRVDEYEIDRPLIEQLVELDIDARDASIVVRPRSTLPELALKPFYVLNNPGAQTVLSFARDFFANFEEGKELSPFQPDTYVPILRKAASHMDRGGRYYPDETDPENRDLPPMGDMLTVTDTWVIFARSRSDNFFLRDLEKLKISIRDAKTLPGPSRRLVTEPSDKSTYSNGTIDIAKSSLTNFLDETDLDPKETHGAVPNQVQQFFFPKPFNEDQASIIQRLEHADGVVVQGPPGTGKTHTIANIICHSLATGKRVLVSSKAEAALAVLREHIPAEIRELTIHLLTSEREGLRQLERAVTLLVNAATQVNPKQLERDIISGQKKILHLRQQIHSIDAELGDFARSHLQYVSHPKGSNKILPMELAEQIMMEANRHSWFPDALKSHGKKLGDGKHEKDTVEPGFTDENIAAARKARKLLLENLVYVGKELLPIDQLPDGETIAAIHVDLVNADKLQRETSSTNTPILSSIATKSRVEKLLKCVEVIVDFHETAEDDPWLLHIFDIWRRRGFNTPEIMLFNELVPVIKSIAAERNTVIQYGITLPENAWKNDDLNRAVERAALGERPFGLLSFGKSQSKQLLAETKILGRTPQSKEDWKKISAYLNWLRDLSGFVTRWNVAALEYDLPVLAEKSAETGRWVNKTNEILHHMQRIITDEIQFVLTELQEMFPSGLDPAGILKSKTQAESAALTIGVNLSMLRLAGSKKQLSGLLDELNRYSGPIIDEIKHFINHKLGNPSAEPADIADQWQLLCKEFHSLCELLPQIAKLEQTARLVRASGAEKWADALLNEPVDPTKEDHWTPATWRESWDWVHQSAYLRSIDNRHRIRELSGQRQEAEEELKKTIQDVVKNRTYLGLKKNITERVESALVMYTNAIRRIGKGTGIRAHRFRKDAQKAMEIAYSAVPCWIMPGWRVSETLPPDIGSFDLVIVDEASQSDIDALPVLLRGKKVLVVGDDKQVSPTAAFVEEKNLLRLKHNYLKNQPFGSLMLPGASLYDLASAVFSAERILLREHFRCVEPIIRFSFQFYNEDLFPLRLPKNSERLDPPLVDVYIPNGRKSKQQVNMAEAECIVDEIEKIVSDPTYKGRSIGVVSLIGSNQANVIQSLLLERIGEEPFLTHGIACGDSATFQGKERDIMFVSMVECSETKSAKTALLFQQRFNVALSRARDRMYLFRSVSESHLNPYDLKAKVIRHFKAPMGDMTEDVSNRAELCQSKLEEDVYSRLIELGYRVIPQVKVGPYSIDLVVEGSEDQRLAVELDGDQYDTLDGWLNDRRLQRILERVGWRFLRCWAVSFVLDPEGCMEDLVGELDAMGITPIEGEIQPTVYTEHRVVEVEVREPEKDLTGAIAPIKSKKRKLFGKKVVESENEDTGESIVDSVAMDPGSHEETTSTADGPMSRASKKAEFETIASDEANGTEPLNNTIVEVGDRVLLTYADDPKCQKTVTISSEQDDLEMNVVHAEKPLAKALINSQVDDEVQVEDGDDTQTVIVIKIDKSQTKNPNVDKTGS